MNCPRCGSMFVVKETREERISIKCEMSYREEVSEVVSVSYTCTTCDHTWRDD